MLSLWQTLGKTCRDPTVLHDVLTEGKVLPVFLASALPLPREAVGVCDGLHLIAAHQEARGFELTADKQQAKTRHLLHRLPAPATSD